MNNKDKFLMFLSLICLPFGELAAEQIGNMEVFPNKSGDTAKCKNHRSCD